MGPRPTRAAIFNLKLKKKPGNRLEFQSCIRPAPMSVKPLAALLSPYRSPGCSVFCNHPTKNYGLRLAIEKTKRRKLDEDREAEMMGELLEDLLCRRGRVTPGGSASPSPALQLDRPRESRPHLVLNLRRTASQDTGRTSVGLQSVFSPSPSSMCAVQPMKVGTTTSGLHLPPTSDTKNEGGGDGATEEEEDDVVKRRGKIRKKKRKSGQPPDRGEKEVRDLAEPCDTLVSTFDGEEWYSSSEVEAGGERGAGGRQPAGGGAPGLRPGGGPPSPPTPLSSEVFDLRTLRHLRRGLSVTQMEAEFRKIWRRVLEEALAASEVLPKEEVKVADDVPPPQPQTWIAYPRNFSRSSARFDLPINKKLLNDMKPLDYLRDYVANSKANLLLFDYVFKKYSGEDGKIKPEALMRGLGEIMGREFSEDEKVTIQDLIDLENNSVDYRTWLGVAAFTERFYGEKFLTGKDMDMGKRQIIEKVDFESLERRMNRLNLNSKIAKLLNAISTS